MMIEVARWTNQRLFKLERSATDAKKKKTWTDGQKMVGRRKKRSISAKTTADDLIFASKTFGHWSFLEMLQRSNICLIEDRVQLMYRVALNITVYSIKSTVFQNYFTTH